MATRVHYTPDCPDESGDDTLAVTGEEAQARVNCPTCLPQMLPPTIDRFEESYG